MNSLGVRGGEAEVLCVKLETKEQMRKKERE